MPSLNQIGHYGEFSIIGKDYIAPYPILHPVTV
jgi:hypothetical protein